MHGPYNIKLKKISIQMLLEAGFIFKITSALTSDVLPYPVKLSIDKLKGQYLIAWARLIERQ
jgi:hypothetical protein